MKRMEHELFVCQCGDVAHQFVISQFKDDETDPDKKVTEDDWDLFIEVKLNRDYNIFRRIWHAFKYVFGMPSKYGDFDEVILNREERKRLIKILSDF